MHMSGFNVLVVRRPVSGQKIDFVKNSYPFLRNLQLVDNEQKKGKIDLLIGAHFYWSVFDGAVKMGDDGGPLALGSKLRWLLSGPVTKYNSSCFTTHTENSIELYY